MQRLPGARAGGQMHGIRGSLWAVAIAASLAFGGSVRAACDPGFQVVISEFMALNTRTLADLDYPDWIELYRPCVEDVDLGGWYLTDDPDDLTRWQFPSMRLGRGDFVFASGKNRAVAGRQLHTSFKPDAGGEYLTLVRFERGGGAWAEGETRRVAVTLDDASGIEGLDLVLSYHPDRIEVRDVRGEGIGLALSTASHTSTGTTRIAMYGVEPLQGSGVVLTFTVTARHPLAAGLPITVGADANEGLVEVKVSGRDRVSRSGR